jgi:carbon storage regulator CsrA
MWRRPGESLIVGDSIEIEVIEARPNRVKLGVVAPESVLIARKETRIIRDENVTAACSIDHGAIAHLLRRFPR